MQVTVIAGPVREHPTTPERGGLFASRELYRGIQILRTRSTTFSKGSIAGRICNYLTYFLCAFLAGWFDRRPDLIVAYTDPPVIGLAAWFRSRILGAKFVLVCQDIFPQVAMLLDGFRKGVVYSLLDFVSRLLIHAADAVVAIGETMRARLVQIKKAHPAKVHVIHNWTDCAAIVPSIRKNEFSAQHGWDDKFVVMHSGNVGLSQSLETLLEAAAHLRDKPDIRIAIVGDGAKKTVLQSSAAEQGLDNVQFLPYQPKESLSQSFGAADAFIVSLKQGMSGFIVPSKLYGILAAGRPYVAAVEEDCEVAAITRQYQCGLLCLPGNAKDLAEKVLQLYNDRQQSQLFGERGRMAAEEYDRPKQVEKYDALFSSLREK